MPELPEVETIVRDLSQSLEGKTFSDVSIHDDFVLRQKPGDFIRRIKNRSIIKIFRRGKAVIMQLASTEFLVVQPMMTGQLVVNGAKDRHTRITFIFADGTRLLYNDQRRFGQLRVVEKLDKVSYLNILGPEPFSVEFSPDYMYQVFRQSKRPIKNVLLDHTFVAGIGNIYACEILFRSHLNPKRRAGRITRAQAKAVYSVITEVLSEAIAHRGSSMRNYRDGRGQKGSYNGCLKVYARQGQPCPRCRQSIRRIVQSGRSTFYCGHCQK